ncbi:DoxX family protein [Streptacidiphilus fuscans]|uniref:DoxX family protein n=1 Tax=Streptacidiphilus fuscans TaxID=2789292 RepID=A0A931B201_9ACTN|nr:hypothetical protein [Streptacidiphilus fuscans]MBF9069629.1 hypothetical protein [Streptacidiphilus fuscans]
MLATAGALHFLSPKPFDAMVPRALPGPARAWTYASGVAELAVAAALASPRHRRLGGRLAAGLFVAVLPANVQMAVDWRERPLPLSAGAWARLPLQLPLVVEAVKVARGSGGVSAPCEDGRPSRV